MSLLIRLRPTGPWRIGPDSGDSDRVERVYHSDTLYSAVTSAMARLGGLDEWLDATARAPEPAVRFSSCFPFHGDALYVVPPRNLWPPPASSKVRWKGARFVPLSVIQGMLHGKPVSEDGWAVDGESETLIAMGTQGPFRVAVRSSAAVDREGAGVAPHSSACLEFAPNAGLWMSVAFADEKARGKWKGPVTAALRLLADSGFGGERSRGWGRAEIEVSEQRHPLVSGAAAAGGENVWWMLSLYHPSSGDPVDWTRGNYAVTTRSGRVESDARWGDTKRSTRMITEGSVLIAAAEPRGSIADVAPEGFPHPVYRAGYAMAIQIALKPVAREAAKAPGKAAPVEVVSEISEPEALLPEMAEPLTAEPVALMVESAAPEPEALQPEGLELEALLPDAAEPIAEEPVALPVEGPQAPEPVVLEPEGLELEAALPDAEPATAETVDYPEEPQPEPIKYGVRGSDEPIAETETPEAAHPEGATEDPS